MAEDGTTGYAEAADRLVRAVRASGVSVEYLALGFDGQGHEPVIGKARRDTQPGAVVPAGAPTVAHLVPEHYPQVQAEFGGTPLIGHTVWETDAIPGHWAELLNRLDRLIVPTEWNRLVFVDSGVTTPTVVLPHVIDDIGGPAVDPGLDLAEDLVVFSSIGRWAQRKRPDLTLRAFLSAFTGRDPVVLVVKTDPVVEYSISHGWSRPGRLSASPGLELARLLATTPTHRGSTWPSTRGRPSASEASTVGPTASSRFPTARGGGWDCSTRWPTALRPSPPGGALHPSGWGRRPTDWSTTTWCPSIM